MSDFTVAAKGINDPEQLASAFLRHYFRGQPITYPINPFQMLLDEAVLFAVRDFGHLEGVYIPAENSDDVATVGINLNRPISRQRFTAAHELCHHFRDADRQICAIGKKTAVEVYADRFASGILMPFGELRAQVNKRKMPGCDYIELDDVLEIADYFGVSFEACLFRIAYLIHAVPGNTESSELKKAVRKYRPEDRRKERGLNNVILYKGLIDSYTPVLRLVPNSFIRNVFENEYIFNDSRMEGVDVSIEAAAEIITDIRMNRQDSEYCSQQNEAYLSIAGHTAMYTDIFALPAQEGCSVFECVSLNRKLFSYFPHPEFGGQTRQSNTLVLGAKFETVDYHKILPELVKLDEELKEFFAHKAEYKVSDYIEYVIRLHHKMTVVHPFADGNGRTLRAFINVLLVRNGLTPVYIKVENKNEYLAALQAADLSANYSPLYEFFFKAILRANADLTR